MNKSIPIVNKDNQQVGEFQLKNQWIELEKGEQAVHDTVVAFLNDRRAGTACTKTRGEVSGRKQKPYRQKGTGRARAGSTRSPLWKGGGIIFGPRPRHYHNKINKKVRVLAVKRAFSERVAENAVAIIDELALDSHKTKLAVQLLDTLQLGENVLVLVDDHDPNLERAFRNLPKAQLLKVKNVNTYLMLKHQNVLFTEKAIASFVRKFEKSTKSTAPAEETTSNAVEEEAAAAAEAPVEAPPGEIPAAEAAETEAAAEAPVEAPPEEAPPEETPAAEADETKKEVNHA